MQSPEDVIAQAKKQLRSIEDNVTVLRHEERQLSAALEKVRPEIMDVQRQVERLSVVRGLLQGTIDATTNKNLRKTEEMVNTALENIFPERNDLKFFFTTETKRDISTIIPHIRVGTTEGTTNTHGGGLLAPISLVLRVVTNIFANNIPLIVIDESLVHISAKYQLPTAKFIEDITREFGITVLLVTHQPLFAERADKIIHLSQTDTRMTYQIH